MPIPIPAIVATLMVTAAPAPPAQTGPGTPDVDDRFAAVDSILRTVTSADGPGVLVALIDSAGIRWSRAAGMANVSHGVPMEPDTRINVGSTAKTLMGFALSRLHLEGAVSLDDDVRRYLPELPDLGETVTLRHLLTHTSGYREFLNALAVGGWRLEDSDYIDSVEALRVVQRQPSLQNVPGAEWNYNNTGYVLLGMVVERVSGVPYPQWVQREVLDPLGMRDSMFRLDPSMVIPGAAYGYLPKQSGAGQAPPQAAWREGRDVGAAVGAGAFYTTLDDLSRWMLALTGEDARWADAFAVMAEPFTLTDGTLTSYGLGMEIDRMAGLQRLHHPGGDIGHQSHFQWFPEMRQGVVIVSNRGDFPATAAGAITAALLGLPMSSEAAPPPRSADGVHFPEDVLARFEGSYELEVQPGFVLTIRVEEGGLVAQATGQPAFPLVAAADTSFSIEAVGARLTFEFDDNDGEGRASSLILHQAGQVLAAPRRSDPAATLDLEQYAGRFHSDELETAYTVIVEDGGLRFEHRRRGPVRLSPVGDDAFVGSFPLVRVRFERDVDDAVTGFVVDAVRARDMRFDRVP